jgi:hypothetical protein
MQVQLLRHVSLRREPSEVHAQAPPSDAALGTHPVQQRRLSPTVGQGRQQRVEHPVDRGAAVGVQPGTARVSESPSPSGPSSSCLKQTRDSRAAKSEDRVVTVPSPLTPGPGRAM